MKKNIFLLLCVTILFPIVNCQNKINAVDVFKMYLFLNKRTFKSDRSIVKNDSTYLHFSDFLYLSLDTLQVYNSIKGAYYNEFDFYKLSQFGIHYKDNSTYNKFHVEFGFLGYYILCINNKTGICYRLAGFDVNDFYDFLFDFQSIYLQNNMRKVSKNTFFKKFKVENLNFLCIYKGLKKQKKKTPICLFKNEEPMSWW